MDTRGLRRRLTLAAAAAEREREKAERAGHCAARDVWKGRAMGLREAANMVAEEEAKE